MKKKLMNTCNFLTIIVICIVLIASCGDKNLPVKPQPDNKIEPPTPPVPVNISTKSIQIDSIKKVIAVSEFNNITKDSVWKDSSGISFFIKYKASSFRILPENEKIIFPGMFFKTADFVNNLLSPFHERKSPIRLYSTLLTVEPADSIITPSQSAFEGLLNRWFNKSIYSGSTSGFAARGETFSNYSKQFLKFSGTITYFEPVSLSELRPSITQDNISKRYGIFIYTNAILHSANFDYLYEKMVKNYSFIAQINYGYEIYVFLESDIEQDKLRPTINRALDGTETSNDITVLKQCVARVYYNHPNSTLISQKNLDGYERIKEFKNILAKPLHNKGVPLYFSALNENHQQIAVDKVIRMDFLLK